MKLKRYKPPLQFSLNPTVVTQLTKRVQLLSNPRNVFNRNVEFEYLKIHIPWPGIPDLVLALIALIRCNRSSLSMMCTAA